MCLLLVLLQLCSQKCLQSQILHKHFRLLPKTILTYQSFKCAPFALNDLAPIHFWPTSPISISNNFSSKLECLRRHLSNVQGVLTAAKIKFPCYVTGSCSTECWRRTLQFTLADLLSSATTISIQIPDSLKTKPPSKTNPSTRAAVLNGMTVIRIFDCRLNNNSNNNRTLERRMLRSAFSV